MEDEQATAWALAQRLQDEGYVVLTAPSAERGLEMLRTCSCDLVIADLGLPGMGGVELIRRLRRRKRSIPAFAITGRGGPLLVRQVLGAGALQCFLKPFRVELLVDGVRQALSGGAA